MAALELARPSRYHQGVAIEKPSDRYRSSVPPRLARDSLPDLAAQVDERLLHNDKMSSLGQLIAGIAHEINNPLNFIYGNLDFLRQYMGDLVGLIDSIDALELPPAVRQKLAEHKAKIDYQALAADWQPLIAAMQTGAERTMSLVQDMRDFSRIDHSELVPCNLAQILTSTLQLLTTGHAVEIRKTIASPLPDVLGHPGRLGQVMMNIVSNGISAARANEGVAPWVEIEIAVEQTRKDEPCVAIHVRDSGKGIAPEALAHITEPFFTTKPVGQGTGLGLWICHMIVRSLGGTISWGNHDRGGAEFIVRLAQQ